MLILRWNSIPQCLGTFQPPNSSSNRQTMISNVNILLIVHAVRELTRGLGIHSSFKPFVAGQIPCLITNVENGPGKFMFEPVSIFDSLLFNHGISLAKNAEVFLQYEKEQNSIDSNQFIYQMLIAGSNLKNANELFHLTTGPGLYVQLGNLSFNLQVPFIYTNSNIVIGSVEFGQEFLLNDRFRYSGYRLQAELDRNNMTTIYGPKTLRLMEYIGYEPVISKKKQNLTLSDASTFTNLTVQNIKSFFKFNLKCFSSIGSYCAKIGSQLLEAGYRISSSLSLKKVIIVDVNFLPIAKFCVSGQDCYIRNVARGHYLLARKDNGAILQYPRAALKQYLDLPDETADMSLNFDSNALWHYDESGGHPTNSINFKRNFINKFLRCKN